LEERGKIYWHGAFYEALQLELHQYKEWLAFDDEYRLSEEALRMDVLVVKKNKDVQIEKNIGRIFKGHNIFEYKSETDNFSLWDYNKVLGYAFMYSAFEKVPMPDITISISLTIFPRELIKILENERGYIVQRLDNGIHYIEGDVVPIQLLESKNLSAEENLFLRNLRSNLSSEDMLKTLQLYKERKPLNEKDVFLDRLVKANLRAFKEAMNMSEAVKEIFLAGAEEHGWLVDRDIENLKVVAKRMLLDGESVERVAKWTELSLNTVMDLV